MESPYRKSFWGNVMTDTTKPFFPSLYHRAIICLGNEGEIYIAILAKMLKTGYVHFHNDTFQLLKKSGLIEIREAPKMRYIRLSSKGGEVYKRMKEIEEITKSNF